MIFVDDEIIDMKNCPIQDCIGIIFGRSDGKGNWVYTRCLKCGR